jgi:NTP pyrophosphatase (non-canonical NTP hydrolase)
MKESDLNKTVKDLKAHVKKFVKARKWEKYHNPKNLAEAICIEAAELLEIFQWSTVEEVSFWKNNPSKLNSIKEELADVLIYCLSMANTLDIDLSEAILEKLEKNNIKYPVKKYLGQARL